MMKFLFAVNDQAEVDDDNDGFGIDQVDRTLKNALNRTNLD